MTRLIQPDAIAGALLGCAVGDAIGLPYEAISKRRGVRLFGQPDRHRFLLGYGMVSDDTEHTCMVAQSLCAAPNDVAAFTRRFSWRLRWWLLGLPVGIGSATLRSIVKLWLGFSTARSGVFSAGNGPAMRSPILGAAIDDLETLRSYVRASTRLTHTDPKAYYGAFAIALAAWCAKRGIDNSDAYFSEYRGAVQSDSSEEFHALMNSVEQSLIAGQTTSEFADQLGCRRGVSGYIYRTVPVALHCWLSHPRDVRTAVATMVRCGGDTDTTAAIVGAIVGSGTGRAGIPNDWLQHLWEWPRTVRWMERLAETADMALKSGRSCPPPKVIPLVGFVRNAIFLIAVLVHLMRRMLPPY